MTKKMSKIVIIGLIICFLVLLGILGSYAFFVTTSSNKNEEVNVQTGTLALTFADGNNGITEALEFGGSVEKTFSIENVGTLDAWAKINFEDLVNTYLENSLTFTLSYSESENGEYTDLITNKNMPRSESSSTKEIVNSLSIPAGVKYFYKLKITLNYLDDTDQTNDLNAIFSTHFGISKGTPKYIVTFMNEDNILETKEVFKNESYGSLPTPTKDGYVFLGWYTEENGGGERITEKSIVNLNSSKALYAKWELKLDAEAIRNKIGKSAKSGNPTFKNQATTDETTNGLYTLKDDYGTSYYYRGNVTDNYVKFADFYWRIIRINGDGSVRLLYDGTSAHENGSLSSDTVASSFVTWNSTNNNDAKYVGYMYGGKNGVASTKRLDLRENGYEDSLNAIYNETNSNVKTVLENWYKNNLTGYDNYIADNIFCNDRSFESRNTGTGIGTKTTYYGGRGRTGISSGTSRTTIYLSK